MEPIVIPWMTPEETEQLLRELRAPAEKDKAALAKPIKGSSQPVVIKDADVALNVQSL